MEIKTINANTLKDLLDKGEAILVDVREPGEFKANYIPGAKLIPLGEITGKSLPEASGKKIVIHCQAGKRGGKACEKLLAENPNLEIYNLEGGISSWSNSGFQTRTSGKFFLPLDRQVQLTIGLFLLIGSVLGYLFSPNLFFLTGFFGLGLTFAGLTGFCGLAHIIAKMPWNR